MATRSASDDVPAKQRKQSSAVTNGTRLHVEPPGDTKWARRFADILYALTRDLIAARGNDNLNEADHQDLRRCAYLCCECENMEGTTAAGDPTDIRDFVLATGQLGRTFQRLGLRQREPFDITNSINEEAKHRHQQLWDAQP